MTSNTRNTVLVVDDNPAILRLVSRSLQSTAEVVGAADSDEALDAFSEDRPLVAFIDIHLGEGTPDGVSLVEKIREFDNETPICMLSADRTPRALIDCLMAGANDYIWKGCINPTVGEAMKQTVFRLRDSEAPRGCPITDNSILQSRGLATSQLALLADYARAGFPELDEFSTIAGVDLQMLTSRFYRIRTMLGLPSHDQLIQLLRVAHGYRGRMSRPPARA